jgi:Tfp pilus assembly protein PilF
MAEKYSKQAIQNAEDMLRSIDPVENASEESVDHQKARRVVSDRKGNLAIIYMQQKHFTKAFQLIEELLVEDKKNLYIRGMVVKQGTLGEYYLAQGEIASAERVFASALDFIRRRDELLFNSEWNAQVR